MSKVNNVAMERLMQRVASLLLAEEINLHDQERARKCLSGCVLPKKCLQAYDLLLNQQEQGHAFNA